MAQIDWDSLGFDAYRTRTVVLAHYRDGAWSDISLTETFSFTIDPFTQGLHYAISCFEGLKAFRQKNGDIIMFRPDKNAARMARSARFLGLPAPPEDLFIKMCRLCVENNLEFLPPYGHQASLYLRPLLFAPHPQMQLVPYPEVCLAVMCAPAGSYYGAHLRSAAAVIPGDFDRAAPKGTGSYKLSANYAGTFVPYKIAHEQGYAELLYLNSATREFVDEFGSSNFFGIKGNQVFYLRPVEGAGSGRGLRNEGRKAAHSAGRTGRVRRSRRLRHRRRHYADVPHRHETGPRRSGGLAQLPLRGRWRRGPRLHPPVQTDHRHPVRRNRRYARLVHEDLVP